MILCPGCGFSNLDTQKSCVRCKRLLLAEPVDCNPPRSKKRGRWVRDLYFGWRRYFGFRYRPERGENAERGGILSGIAEATGFDQFRLPTAPWLWPVNFILPGVWQLAAGRPIRGIIFSTGFVLGVIGIWSTLGTIQPLAWMLGLAATAQANAICDMVTFNHLSFVRRLAVVSVIGIMAFFGYYRLDERGINLFLDWSCPDRITVYHAGEGNVVRDGEIVELKRPPGNRYQVGDLVVHRYGRLNQVNLLRVLAVPGDQCKIIDRTLHVNGGEQENLGYDYRNLDGTLADSEYIVRLIVPQVIIRNQRYYYHYDQVWKETAGAFAGKADRVVYPWWRRRPLP